MEKYRKNIRLKHYDYSTPGAYFVTICTNFKKDLIGEEEQEIINKELELLEQRFPSVKIDYFTIMPDHIHLILIFKKEVVSLPQVIQAFKSLSTRRIKEKGYSQKRFWQPNYYEHVIRNEKALLEIRRYIQNNPKAEELDFEEIYQE